ncbi:MAG: imidazole glycerol phosphate synthase cyclase subunit [Verrucomicrobiae bacterium]|nr:imidazole glycerol phosphate synthase cyclase subunit [Verrucomicrobiae bacterium]
MLKTRVIPTLLWKGAGLVKGVAFDSWRRVGTVLPAIKVYNTREVDELVLLDINGTREQREPDYESVAEYSAECFVPLTVGGGVRTLEHIQKLLEAGADKVAINSAAYQHPQLVQEGARHFGSQCIVASVDVRRHPTGRYECFSHCGQQPTGQEPVAWARRLQDLGAGEILLTRVERDGTFEGYDLELIEQVAQAVTIPVIASGGAGSYVHLLQALQKGASAVAAASIFHFTEQTPKEAKAFLASHGIRVRQTTPL